MLIILKKFNRFKREKIFNKSNQLLGLSWRIGFLLKGRGSVLNTICDFNLGNFPKKTFKFSRKASHKKAFVRPGNIIIEK